ncbi:MAG: metal ABC transporter substrate-binding protein [Actinomycetota bacterium]|nr:metal ABC transporter substrate-binding protein [Actinomycetota bacterium]
MVGEAVGAVRRVFAMGVAWALLAACGASGSAQPSPPAEWDRLKIATTVSPITSLAASIAGDRADITGIVPEGTNSHTFEPKPSVAGLLSTSDVLYMNGLGLEEPTRALAEQNLKAGAEIVELGSAVLPDSEFVYDFSFPREEGRPNPHLWTDPPLARRYAEVIKDDLSKRDPANADYYQRNYEEFAQLVDQLDSAMRQAFSTIPAANRKVLTYHDSFAYFAKDYGFQVIGAIQPANFEEPTPREVAELIEQVRREHVPAIFGSEVFPSPVLEQIGKETGVRYVDVLRDDDLPGAPGDPEHSWLGLMRFDYATITEALGGDASSLRALEIPSVPDTARYPQ